MGNGYIVVESTATYVLAAAMAVTTGSLCGGVLAATPPAVRYGRRIDAGAHASQAGMSKPHTPPSSGSWH
jgi:hypothetical protein